MSYRWPVYTKFLEYLAVIHRPTLAPQNQKRVSSLLVHIGLIVGHFYGRRFSVIYTYRVKANAFGHGHIYLTTLRSAPLIKFQAKIEVRIITIPAFG